MAAGGHHNPLVSVFGIAPDIFNALAGCAGLELVLGGSVAWWAVAGRLRTSSSPVGRLSLHI